MYLASACKHMVFVFHGLLCAHHDLDNVVISTHHCNADNVVVSTHHCNVMKVLEKCTAELHIAVISRHPCTQIRRLEDCTTNKESFEPPTVHQFSGTNTHGNHVQGHTRSEEGSTRPSSLARYEPSHGRM